MIGALLATAAFAGESSRLEGAVRDARDQRPLPGVRVTLVEIGRDAATDSAGRYAFDAPPPGPHDLAVRALGYRPRTVHALVPGSGVLTIDIAMTPDPVRLGQVEVRPAISLPDHAHHDSASTHDREVSVAALRQHPLLAEADAFQGIGGTDAALDPEAPSGIHVHGGAADQTGYLIDGVPVHQPYHAAGLTSAWNPDALSMVRLWSTRPSPRGPDFLSGALEGSLRAWTTSPRAQLAVSTTQARLTIDGPLGSAGAGYLLGVRSGLHDLFAPKSESSYLGSGTVDAIARVEAPIGRYRVGLLVVAHDNEVEATADAAAGNPPPRHAFDWEATSFGFDAARPLGAGDLRLLLWDARSRTSARWIVPGTTTEVAARRRDLGGQLAYARAARRATTRAALRIERLATDYRIAGPAGLALVGEPVVLAGSVEHSQRIGAASEVGLGVSLAGADSHLHPAGSARIAVPLSSTLVATARYSRTRQFVQSLGNAESAVGVIFPANLDVSAGEATVPVAHGDLVGLDLELRPRPGMRFDLAAWTRDAHGLALVAPRSGAPFATQGFVEGDLAAHGFSAGFVARSARFGGLLDYAFERVELSHGDSTYVPAAAPRHRLTGGVVVFPSASTSVRLGVTTAFGRRTTVSIGEIEWESCNFLDRGCEFIGSPELGDEARGGTPLPDYVRVDLGLRKHWHVALGDRDATVSGFLTVTNLLSRTNVLTYTRSATGSGLTAVEMRPLAPLVFGFEARF